MTFKDFEKYRDKANLTNKDIQDKTGISMAYLYGWKTGKYNPNPRKIMPLVNLLNIPVEEILK